MMKYLVYHARQDERSLSFTFQISKDEKLTWLYLLGDWRGLVAVAGEPVSIVVVVVVVVVAVAAA